MDTETLNAGKEFQKWGLVGTFVWGLIIALVFIVIQLFSTGVYIGFNFGAIAAPQKPAVGRLFKLLT